GLGAARPRSGSPSFGGDGGGAMGKRLPICHSPRARKPLRSSAVLKRPAGIPYTPKAQMNPVIKRNQKRRGHRHQGKSKAHPNSLVNLLSMDAIELAKKLQNLGFMKKWERDGKLNYRCPKCRGSSGYVSAWKGSMWECGSGISLRQIVGLIVCFSEGIAATPASQLCGVGEKSDFRWYGKFRACIVAKMEKLQKSFGKQGGKGIVVEVDEASVASGSAGPPPKKGAPAFSHTRIIALLVRGPRNIVIEQLPIRKQRYRIKGSQKTMSGGTIKFDGKRLVPPGPPALSIPEGKKFLTKHFKSGILSSDSAATYDSLVNKRKIFGNRAKQIAVVHGKEEWTKMFNIDGKKVWGGTQHMDGFFGNYKQWAKPRHVRRSDVMQYVREYQYWFVTKKEDRLVAFGKACKDYA
ncbi:unnamed protein product, partial [Prorocentrum cordatum]